MTANKTRSIGSHIAHIVFVCVFAVANEAGAITIRVPQDYATIQAAIDAATDGDEIVVSPGVYVENINFRGRAIVLRSVSPTDSATVAATIIDGNYTGSVVTFAGTETAKAVLSGFTIRNGSASSGGGIFGNGTTARIEHNTITGNSASRLENYGSQSAKGGALYGCHGTIQNNVITQNHVTAAAGIGGRAYAYGGALYYCNGTIQNNTITGNSAKGHGVTHGDGYGYGGALYRCNGMIQNNALWLMIVAQKGTRAIQPMTKRDRPVRRTWREFDCASVRFRLDSEACAPASRSCSCST